MWKYRLRNGGHFDQGGGGGGGGGLIYAFSKVLELGHKQTKCWSEGSSFFFLNI